MASACRAVDDAEQRTDRQRPPRLKPWQELLPAPGVHADLAPAPALAAPDHERPAALLEICLGESERFLDAQPGTPHNHDEPSQAPAVRPLTGGAHHGDDLFDLRRIGRVAQTLARLGERTR